MTTVIFITESIKSFQYRDGWSKVLKDATFQRAVASSKLKQQIPPALDAPQA